MSSTSIIMLVEVVEMAGIDALVPGFRHGADYLLK
jgi:hypothetical protein